MKNLRKLSKANLKTIKGGFTQEHHALCRANYGDFAFPCFATDPDTGERILGCVVGGTCISASIGL